MAIAVIGGLITSTFLSLLVIPVVFTYVDDVVQWMKRHLHRRQPRGAGSRPTDGVGCDRGGWSASPPRLESAHAGRPQHQPDEPFPDRHARHGGRHLRRHAWSTCASTPRRARSGLVINKPIDIKLKNLFEKVELHPRPRRPGRGSRCTSAARCRPSAASCCTSGSPATTASHLQLDAADPRRRWR